MGGPAYAIMRPLELNVRISSKIINPLRKKKEIIVVTGLPRSGTSMMMRMLESVGIEILTDHGRVADDDNPRGYYEYEMVKKLKDGCVSWLPLAQGKAIKVISALITYLPSDYRYRILFMQRSIPQVLASQRKMLINRGEDPDKVKDSEMASTFDKHLTQVMDWLSNQQNISTLYIDYNKVINEPAPNIRYINSFLGGFLDEERMIAVVEPDLYRQRNYKIK